MATRNFWIEVQIDGRTTRLKGGPQNKTGGMSIVLKQRDDGAIRDVLTLNCYAIDERDGSVRLRSSVQMADENEDGSMAIRGSLITETLR